MNKSSSTGWKRSSSDRGDGQRKKQRIEKKIISPCIRKALKTEQVDFKLDEELSSILDPVENQLMELTIPLEKVNQILQWAENVKKKIIIKEAELAANKMVKKVRLGDEELAIGTPNIKITETTTGKMARVTFSCIECKENDDMDTIYEGYARDLSHHWLSQHYEYVVYICSLCDPEKDFNTFKSLDNHLATVHGKLSSENRHDQFFAHRYVRRVYNYLKSVSDAAHAVYQLYNPPKTTARRSTAHNKIRDDEKKTFLKLYDLQNAWRIENIFNKEMPLLSMDKDVTIFRRFVKYEDRQNKDFPSQYVYMYPSYILQNGNPIISYTIGCGTVNLSTSGSNQSWNTCLRKSIEGSLTKCASAARANDNKGDDDKKKKSMSFILPQFAIIVYWTEPGTDINGKKKSANVSLKMDGRNLLAKEFNTFFVALYSEGLISQDAIDKVKSAIIEGAKEIDTKVQEYLHNSAT